MTPASDAVPIAPFPSTAAALSGSETAGQLGALAALSFEDALAELERIVRGLEGGQQRLEEAISAYERGSALRQHCEAKLREAEMRVERIVAAVDGSSRAASATQGGSNSELDEEIPF